MVELVAAANKGRAARNGHALAKAPQRSLELVAVALAMALAARYVWHHAESPAVALSVFTHPTWRLSATAAAGSGGHGGARVAAAVDALLAAPLPPRNLNISLEAPLLYIHQRKAAGSSLRRALVEGARAADLPFFAACKAGVRCDTFSLAGAAPAAVYAGHFSWGELRHLWRAAPGWDKQAKAGWRRNPRLGASCLTNFRAPLARLESCFYYKHAVARKARDKAGKAPPAGADIPVCLSNLSAVEIRQFLTSGGEHSCADEPLRMLSGVGDVQDSARGAPTRPAVLELALAHLASCVPVVVEVPASLALVRHWFPQLQGSFHDVGMHNAGTAPRCPLSPAAHAVLAEVAADEQVLYDAAVQRAQRMLAELPSDVDAAAALAAGTAATAEDARTGSSAAASGG